MSSRHLWGHNTTTQSTHALRHRYAVFLERARIAKRPKYYWDENVALSVCDRKHHTQWALRRAPTTNDNNATEHKDACGKFSPARWIQIIRAKAGTWCRFATNKIAWQQNIKISLRSITHHNALRKLITLSSFLTVPWILLWLRIDKYHQMTAPALVPTRKTLTIATVLTCIDIITKHWVSKWGGSTQVPT